MTEQVPINQILVWQSQAYVVLVSVIYEAYNRKKFTHSITLQPPVADQVFMPHMKAMFVPFHMGYGSLISYQRL